VRKVTVQILKEELSHRGLLVLGKKIILLQRLFQFFESESTSKGRILATDFIAKETDMELDEEDAKDPSNSNGDDSDGSDNEDAADGAMD